MRLDTLSSCEKEFILNGLQKNQRLDGRLRDDFRQVKLVVGAECGTVLCMMGSTKVFCAVSASLVEPNQSRPQKGIVTVDIDMSPMGNPANEHNRLGERGMELTRLLELVLRDSRCIDVEALCVRAGQEVWKIRIDVRIMDDDGSLLDCASLAAVTALYHFRRPNVTVEAHTTLIHSKWEQALIPLNIYHIPICVSFGFLNDGKVIVDPTEKEQCCVSGCLVVACNKRKEVCALHQSTHFILDTATLEACVQKAMQRAIDLTELVQTVIQDDAKKRAKYEKPPGFETIITSEFLTCREAHPNELLAPGIDTQVLPGESRTRMETDSVVLNQDPLLGVPTVDEQDEKAIAEQVQKITNDVNDVVIDNNKSVHAKAMEDVDDLLDGLELSMNFLKAFVQRTTYTIGRMVREAGLQLDQEGSKLTKDIAYLENLSRHRNVMPLYDNVPIVLYNTFLAPNSTLIGEVFVGANSSVWYGATLKGDFNAVRVGNNTSIGDQSILNTTPQLPMGIPASLNIGNFVNIENNCQLYSCTIDDGVTVGFKSIVLEGARIERGAVIGPNSVVPPGKLIPAGTYWAGNPVEFVRDLTDEEVQKNITETTEIRTLSASHESDYAKVEKKQLSA